MSDSTEKHYYQQLIDIFDGCFSQDHNTSALHEISHWCVAGAERRKLVDFGYWYCPDGRDAQTQSEFEKVEIKPQSYEWMFCVAAGFNFNVSCDNLSGECEPDRIGFQRKVREEVLRMLEKGLPERPARFIRALQAYYNTPALSAESFPAPQDF
jgi:elongation factor P hydroxylase